MLNAYTESLSSQLQERGYLIEVPPPTPSTQALLYARSPNRTRLGFTKVEDHFLFVDWDSILFGRLEHLKQIFASFSQHANRGFRTPHALRMSLPNLAVILITRAEFPADVITFARTKDLNPWYGGEVGQLILVDLVNKKVVSLASLHSNGHPRQGALALGHSAQIIRDISQAAFNQP